MSSKKEDKLSVGNRCKEERERLGLQRAAVAGACGKTPQAIGEYERGVSYPGGEAMLGFAKIGMDVQYIFTGLRSPNLNQVAEEVGPYKVEKGVGPLSKDEELLVRKYRELNPSDKTHFQAIIVKVASTKGVGKQEGKK